MSFDTASHPFSLIYPPFRLSGFLTEVSLLVILWKTTRLFNI